jgi:hypothetical protein
LFGDFETGVVVGDFVGVHFSFQGLRLVSAFFFGLVAFFAGGADFGADGEIDEALEGGELSGCAFAGGGEVHAGVEDRLVSFIELFVVGGNQEIDVAPGE